MMKNCNNIANLINSMSKNDTELLKLISFLVFSIKVSTKQVN